MNNFKALGNLIVLVSFLSIAAVGLPWQHGHMVSAPQENPNLSGDTISRVAIGSVPTYPAYDSGWVTIGSRPDPLSIPITHNLGGDPDDYLVRLMCRDQTTLATYDCTDFGFNPNALWYALTDTSVQVWITASPRPDAIRVVIYKTSPSYDSGWLALLARPDPISVLFDHQLGGDEDNYLVSLECKDGSTLATYSCTDLNFNVNALWYALTDTSVTLWINNGPRPDEVRVRVFEKIPDYDSGWVALGGRPDPIPVPLNHFLGGNPEDYLISLICRDNSALATYGCTNLLFNHDGGWFGLDGASIKIWVQGGTRPDDVRVRIWALKRVYLPLIQNN